VSALAACIDGGAIKPEEFGGDDRERFQRFMEYRKFDCHPQASLAERIENIGVMLREYILLKRIFR
jgi:hypothetical protein